MKLLFVVLGCLALGLGIAGIFLPLVPTTPFLLLTAALWVHSSPRLYAWLLSHRYLGTYIRNYREKRAIPLQAKLFTLALMWVSMLWCTFSLLDGRLWAQGTMLIVAVGVTWHVLSLGTLKK